MSKRINLTVSDEVYKALTDLQETTGVGKASFAGQMLENSLPMLQNLVEAARQAQQSPERSLDLMQRALLDAQGEANDLQGDLLEKGIKLRRYQRGDDGP